MTTTKTIPAAPATRTHEVLAELGHTIHRVVLPDGTLGVWEVRANPARADKWGCITEADWALADAAEAAPVHGCRRR
jgi:hypothetical protein